MVKHLPAVRETQVQSLGQEDLLEKEMATHSSILAWKIPWTEEPGKLKSMGLQRVGYDWAISLSFTFENSNVSWYIYLKIVSPGNSLVDVFTATGSGSIPGQGTKILRAMQNGQKKKGKKDLELKKKFLQIFMVTWNFWVLLH